MQTINLLDRRLLPPPPDWLTLGLLALTALAGLATLGHGLSERRALAALLAQAAPAEAEADTPDPELQALADRVARAQALHQGMQLAGVGVEQAGRTLQGVAAALAGDMWLEEVELHHDRTLRVRGRSVQAASLAGFAERLQQQGPLRALPVRQLSLEPGPATEPGADGAGPPALRFQLVAGTVDRPGDTP